MEHAISSYLTQVWDKNDWLYEGQDEFRTGYSCEIQINTVFQDIAGSLDDGDSMNVIIVDFWKAFDLVYHGRLLERIANSGVDSRDIRMDKGIPCSSHADGQGRRATITRS